MARGRGSIRFDPQLTAGRPNYRKRTRSDRIGACARGIIALGSGNPTRIICSALIAQAFEAVRYPILPKVTQIEKHSGAARDIADPSLLALRTTRLRHLSVFRIVKPTLEKNSNYKFMDWADLPAQPPAGFGFGTTDREARTLGARGIFNARSARLH